MSSGRGLKNSSFILDPQGLIFTAKEFENLRQLVEAISIELIFDVAKIMLKISQAASEANKAISNAKAIDFLTVLASEKLHIQQLLSSKARFRNRSRSAVANRNLPTRYHATSGEAAGGPGARPDKRDRISKSNRGLRSRRRKVAVASKIQRETYLGAMVA